MKNYYFLDKQVTKIVKIENKICIGTSNKVVNKHSKRIHIYIICLKSKVAPHVSIDFPFLRSSRNY